MEEKERSRILARIYAAEQWREANYGALWRDCYRRYRSQPEREREGSNLFVPQTFLQCEVIKARLTESLFAKRPYIAALPREDSDIAAAQKLQTLLDWQMNERMDLPRRISDEIMLNMIVYGTGIAYTGWQVKTRRIWRATWQQAPLTNAAGEVMLGEDNEPLSLPQRRPQLDETVVYDDPIVANIALGDFFCDTRAADIASARYCGHKEYLSRAALDKLAENGCYQIDWAQLDSAEGAEAKLPNGLSASETDGRGLYLVHHYWEDARHVVFLERKLCICEEENPFWHGMKPYDKCCYVTLPGEFYGIGIPEILASLQDELNTSRNQRIDYSSLSLRRMWKLRKGCGLTARDLVWRQNGVLQVENMDDVQQIDLQGLPADAFANESTIRDDMRDATGCQDILMGTTYVNETATTTTTRENNASLRFKAIVRSLVYDLLLPITRKCLALDQQFLTQERTVRLLGQPAKELFQLSPEEMEGCYDVLYCGSAMEALTSRDQSRQHALQAYQLALADPAYQADDAARLHLFRKVLDGLGITDSEALLPALRT